MYDAVFAVVHKELANQRPVELPGVGRLVPQEIHMMRFHNIALRKFVVYPKWVNIKFRASPILLAEYRKDYPCYLADENGDPIYPTVDELIA